MNASMRRILVAGVALTATVSLTACGSDDESTSDAAAPMDTTTAAASPSMTTEAADDAMSGLVGPGCAAYAEAVPDGAGSVEGMSTDPVATAASNNPMLKTLTAAVSGKLNPDVDLVDTLNGGEFTVFAPVDDAFAAVPAKTLKTLETDSKTLTDILTYHVVAGQLSADDVVGTQKTVQGGNVEVTGSGDELMVNGANVVCGGVKTANATVYLIDQVLSPADAK
ncbi:cell surface glycolipoprotein MPB83 [Kineosporia sp. NBRC 101677]|uniref:fasciclin domain-containing protein n=1 Tax=Kineosporia TaxID=49184 RepID=UPI000AF062D3|nr:MULTISPECIES: fasciclin domain-containing protein [Kineosporia]GLY13669.1 cell surface glycolipoprotein MPB83 [Kineosporia sp. NBRC 101677]